MLPRTPSSFTMSRTLSLLVVAWLPIVGHAQTKEETPPHMLGFTGRSAQEQMALEKKFDAQLSPADQREWLQRMSAEPNHVGAPHNKANAEFMLEQFRAWGWEARI